MSQAEPPDRPIEADLLVSGATLVTLDAERRVLTDGALAIAGDRIVAVGKRAEVRGQVNAREILDGRRFVASPGFIDAHIHITGDPLTRGFTRGGAEVSPSERLSRWVIPIFRAQSAQEERLAAQCAALAMIRSGTTSFIEAGTVSHLDAVMEGLTETGIRGRVGQWVEGRAWSPADDEAEVSAAAIAVLEGEIARWPDDGGRLAAWPILVGHSTNTDAVWRAAKGLADQHGLGVSAHMSPRAGDPQWFLETYGRRPAVHLEDIGVLGPNVCLTHLAEIDEAEVEVIARTGVNAILCPHAAILGGFGLSQIGLYPEMSARGVNVALGTDGVAADILGAARLMAGLFRDARRDEHLYGAAAILEMATLGGANALGLEREIGSLEVGKKADFVLHDTDLAEWGGTLFDPAAQLAMCAPARGVHSVWIDGVRVVEAGGATTLDEAKLLADARQAGAEVIARTGLPTLTTWPIQ
ncbi:MAG TPA: amidohydrolase family protein [Caulobacteraceae bacterium]